MRLLVRDNERARTRLGTDFEYLQGSVTESAVVDRAVRDMDGVHVSLGVEDPAQSRPLSKRSRRYGSRTPSGARRTSQTRCPPRPRPRGPEQLTLHQALAIYRRIVAPDKRLVTIPLPVMATIDRIFMGGKLAPNLQIMRLLARLGERGDPT